MSKKKIKYADSKKARKIGEKILKKYAKAFKELAKYERKERDKYCDE